MVGPGDVAKIVKTHYNKQKNPEENLTITQPYINDLLHTQEIPVVTNLIHEIHKMCLEKENYLLLNHICYGANIEVATAFIKGLKKEDKQTFNKWVKNDATSQHVFGKILDTSKVI